MSKRMLQPDLLHRPIEGRNLSGATLGKEIGDGPHLLVFLRQFG